MDQLTLACLLLALLFIKHWFADFVVQLDYMVAEKGIYGAAGGLHHSTIHGLLAIPIFLIAVPLPVALILGVVDGAIHYHVDWLKMNINRWRSLDIQKSEFWMWLGADQLAHSLTYLGLVYGAIS
jgi:hypothetical protein